MSEDDRDHASVHRLQVNLVTKLCGAEGRWLGVLVSPSVPSPSHHITAQHITIRRTQVQLPLLLVYSVLSNRAKNHLKMR
jgi:hypothetical protein